MVKQVKTKLVNKTHDLIFKNIHGNRLIYNACWEDPRIDRQLLQLDQNSKLVMITSAGCNCLDYLLDAPQEIHTVDVNPRQNALLHLKLALINRGNYDDLFAMFGVGYHEDHKALYSQVRSELPSYAQDFWDDKINYFGKTKLKSSFYYRGTSGDIAWVMRQYFMQANKKLRKHLYNILDAQTLEEQQQIYDKIEPNLWNAFSRWMVKHPVMMAMLGVPRPQIQLMKQVYPSGIVGYVRDKLQHVFTQVLMKENYFWRVYLTGSYTQSCSPNYLKEENLKFLQENRVKIKTYNCTITDFLRRIPGTYSHFVLLDHQDWLAWHNPQALQEEWQQILRNSQPGAKILMRSAALDVSFLPSFVLSSVRFFPELTQPLHLQDRVGTYGSLHLAEVL